MITHWPTWNALPAWMVKVFEPVPIACDVGEVACCVAVATACCDAKVMSDVPTTTGSSWQVQMNVCPALTAPSATVTAMPEKNCVLPVASVVRVHGPVDAA